MNWTNMGRNTLAGLLLLLAGHAQAVGTLYAGFGGSGDGVSIRSSTTLTETGSFGVSTTLEGIEAGESNNLYVAAGDSITNFDLAGGVLAMDTVADAQYSDVALLGAEIFVTSTGATPGVSARDLNTLVESAFFDTAFIPTSIEDGFGRLYITAGEMLYILDGSGTELANAASGSPDLIFVGSAISGTRLYAATGGAENTISVRNPITLAEITAFPVPFAVDGMVAGDNDDLFIVSGADIFHLSTSGEELDMATDGTADRTFADIAFIAAPRAPSAGTVLAIAAADESSSVSVRDAETLTDAGGFDLVDAQGSDITDQVSGLALGQFGDVLVAAGNSLIQYSTAGSFLQSVDQPDTVFNDVALIDGIPIAATGTGISRRNVDSLVELNTVDLGFEPTSIAQAGAGEIYLTAGNQVFRYTSDGVTELASFSGNSDFTYTDVALVANVVYATYNSISENGISVLDPGSLEQADTIVTGALAASGITPGGLNDYYISGGGTIVHYALDEVLSSTTVGSGTVFPDVAFSTQGSSSQTSIIASTLPAVRSAQVGGIASAFATVINTGPVTASACRIQPATPVAADFSYQTTDSGTNELVGTPDTPVDIASNGVQTFLFSFVPTAAFAATDVELDFVCSNTLAAPVFSGLNTLVLSADDNPVADIVALASTPITPGIIDVPGVGGTGFFAVASVNVGASGDIAVTAVTTNDDPNIALAICETNPMTGECINPTVPTTGVVNLTIEANDTPTFSVFATASAPIALDPALTRVRVNFEDQESGEVRGATSVAIRTQ